MSYIFIPLDYKKPYPKRPRLLDSLSYTGIRGYLITINTYKRKKYFVHSNIVKSLVKCLHEVADQQYFDVVAYTFMPDHIHLLLTGKNEASDLNVFIKQYKQISAHKFKQKFETKLWATSFHDHVLRKQEDIKSVGRYVLKNPVRAGIVQNVLDYPFSGSFVYDLWELVESDPFLDNNEFTL